MIKNQKQAGITERRLAELKRAKSALEDKKEEMDEAKYRLGISAFNSLITDLEQELSQYNQLNEGNIHCLHAKSMNDIPNILVAARLAQKMSHKDLGELIGVKEQQIQRYEATDYETASWTRMVEVGEALNLRMSFERVIILNESATETFLSPKGISKEAVLKATEHIRKRGCLIDL